MNKITVKLGMFVIALLLSISSVANAAKPKMALLPFQVNGSDAAQVAESIKVLLLGALQGNNFDVVVTGNNPPKSASEARQSASNANTLYAIYGTYNQLGQGFTLDARVAQVGSNTSRPFYIEGRRASELSALLEKLASQLPRALVNKDGIADIKIRGAGILDPDRILVQVKSQIGDVANAETLDEDVRAIWDMGYFSDVNASIEDNPLGSGQILIFDVVEKPRIANVKVNGSDEVKEDDIVAAISSTAGTVLNEKLLVEDLQIVKELYRKKGFYLTDIGYSVEDAGSERGATLVFDVDSGKKLYIREVNVNGVDEKTQKKLKKYMKLRKRGLFSFFTKFGVLEEELLQRDTDAIQSYLIDNGYLEAVVDYPTVDYNEEGIIINFNVTPGDRFIVANVRFEGDLLEDQEALYKRIGIDEIRDEKGYFSLQTMQDDMKVLKAAYNDYGFAFADVGVNTPVNKETGTVDVVYILQPKEKVFIRNVYLEGNTETRDNVILRELRIADGQEYDGAKVRRSIERLKRLQYFEDVNVDLIPTGRPGEVDLKVAVTEASTGSVSLGVGYSTYDDFGVSAGINQRNLFGKGYTLGVNGYISGKTLSMRGTFVNPRINDSNLGFFSSVYAEDEEWPDFDRRTVGTSFGLTYPLGEYSAISTSYRLEFYNLDEVAPDASSAIKSYEGDNIASVVTVGFGRDTTNHPLAPTRGTKQNVSLEYGGGILGGSDDFYKLTASYGVYFGLTDNHVLHARGTIGAVFENGNDPIPAFERFYIGGMNSLRGYDYEEVSPQDHRTGESIGATHVAYGSAEYIWRVSEEFGIYLVPFFDIASVYDESYDNFGDNNYYSTGLEVRWNSPFGALRFAYGYPLTESVTGEDLSGRFEFSMGRAF